MGVLVKGITQKLHGGQKGIQGFSMWGRMM